MKEIHFFESDPGLTQKRRTSFKSAGAECSGNPRAQTWTRLERRRPGVTLRTVTAPTANRCRPLPDDYL